MTKWYVPKLPLVTVGNKCTKTYTCPNCGDCYQDAWAVSHSSSVTVGGFIHSTLYGVCKKCADIHTKSGDSESTKEVKDV